MQPLGYTYLLQELEIELPKLGIELYQGKGNRDQKVNYGHTVTKYLAANKSSKINVPAQLEMAIKHQGIRLQYIAMVYDKIDVAELTKFVKERQLSKIRRAMWFLFEWLTGERLDIKDLKSTGYVNLLDPQFYFTRDNGNKCPRTKIINNMLGNRQCCPMIRKTGIVGTLDMDKTLADAEEKLKDLNRYISTDQIGRSLNYLYLKETKSSTEIEREDSSQSKTSRFYQVLKTAGSIPLTKQRLITIQNQIVPTSRGDTDYRKDEIWVGESMREMGGGTYENYHYIAPKKECVSDMMNGLLEMHNALLHEPNIPPLVHATAVSFMFVYIHPFSDGNGRTHRYLIHDILKSRSPKNNFIVPVSSAILNNMSEYDRVLETVSKPVMALIQYESCDKTDSIEILSDNRHLYQFPDLTEHLIFIHKMMHIAFSEDLLNEIFYVIMFDSVKKSFNETFDLSEKRLGQLINVLLQNEGKFSNTKRKKFQQEYTDEELNQMETFAVEAIGLIKAFKSSLAKVDTSEDRERSEVAP
ncbi:Fic family protein [Bowmanella yangjiangensis]|uniref:Fic family protein n=1 Tax=Bowmanella yangjiangensis TaxID=2811230 RepID=A0ABS3CQJ3_9ALTE|nr:Fic family protein [Bowmanella yangjiangensis]MBN7819335.1 Fic family protein [Bowmanella yangjiangensis]